MSGWEGAYTDDNAIELLKMLRDVAHNQVERKQATYSYVELVAEMFLMHQERNQSNDDYYKSFRSHVETIKAHGGRPWGIESLSKKYLEDKSTQSHMLPGI